MPREPLGVAFRKHRRGCWSGRGTSRIAGPPGMTAASRIRGFLFCALSATAACGGSTEPIPNEPGYVVQLSVPGVTDTTLRGTSLGWRVFTGTGEGGAAPVRQLSLEILVLSPPSPLSPPLAFEMRWYQFDAALPAATTYPLGLTPPDTVVLQASSNLGVWASAAGRVNLRTVTDSSLAGSFRATLVPVYPPGATLPDARVEGSFWAPRGPAVDVEAGQRSNPRRQPTGRP
jgi:hypothetical protein